MHPGSTERAQIRPLAYRRTSAGNYAVMQTVLRHNGVVLVETMDELIDAATLLARWPAGASKGAAIVAIPARCAASRSIFAKTLDSMCRS